MKFTIETIKKIRTASMTRIGAYGAENAELMKQIKKWAQANGFLSNDIYAAAMDNPETTPPEKCRYTVCVVIGDAALPYGANEWTIPDGKYAVARIQHTAEEVSRAWSELFPSLAEAGLAFDGTKAVLERYKAALVGQGLCELLVPIK